MLFTSLPCAFAGELKDLRRFIDSCCVFCKAAILSSILRRDMFASLERSRLSVIERLRSLDET